MKSTLQDMISRVCIFLILFVPGILLAGNNPLLSSPPYIVITVSGTILNDSTGKGVPNHGVTVTVPYISWVNTVYTDSLGNYADTIPLPGMGDTLRVSTFDCHDILHSQAQLIESYTLIVNFTICVKFTPHCKAGFISEIDSSTAVPLKYRFYDLSSGNPQNWFWSFGDGSFSHDRNPVHQYGSEGTYTVKLTVSNDTPCSDSAFDTIITRHYLSIGGHAFAGIQPINNPVSTGDTGIVYLYKMIHNQVTPYDTILFTYLGYYSFPYLLPGSYMLKILLTPRSIHAGNFAPTYYVRKLYWQQSESVRISEQNIFDFDVFLQPANDSLNGTSKITGKVSRHSQLNRGTALYRSEILLLDSAKNFLTYALSDGNGYFTFEHLPFGNYLLFAESTGKFSKYTQVILDPEHPFSDTLSILIYDHNVLGIEEISAEEGVSAGNPFPNPASGEISLPLVLRRQMTVGINVLSLQSKLMISEKLSLPPGIHTVNLSLRNLHPGMYLLTLTGAEGKILFTGKLVKL